MATNFLLLNLDKNEVTVFDPKNFINMVVYIPLLHVIKRYLLCGCFIQSPCAFFFSSLFPETGSTRSFFLLMSFSFPPSPSVSPRRLSDFWGFLSKTAVFTLENLLKQLLLLFGAT